MTQNTSHQCILYSSTAQAMNWRSPGCWPALDAESPHHSFAQQSLWPIQRYPALHLGTYECDYFCLRLELASSLVRFFRYFHDGSKKRRRLTSEKKVLCEGLDRCYCSTIPR